MGILNILNKTFLLFGEEVKPICALENHDIYELVSISFIPFDVFL